MRKSAKLEPSRVSVKAQRRLEHGHFLRLDAAAHSPREVSLAIGAGQEVAPTPFAGLLWLRHVAAISAHEEPPESPCLDSRGYLPDTAV